MGTGQHPIGRRRPLWRRRLGCGGRRTPGLLPRGGSHPRNSRQQHAPTWGTSVPPPQAGVGSRFDPCRSSTDGGIFCGGAYATDAARSHGEPHLCRLAHTITATSAAAARYTVGANDAFLSQLEQAEERYAIHSSSSGCSVSTTSRCAWRSSAPHNRGSTHRRGGGAAATAAAAAAASAAARAQEGHPQARRAGADGSAARQRAAVAAE